VEDYQALRAKSYYYFETMLMLILILWLIKWLFACPIPAADASHIY